MTQKSPWASKRFFDFAALIILACLSLSGCSNLLFYPHKTIYNNPENLGVEYQEYTIPTEDGLNITVWLLKPQNEIKGTVIHLHGNAENMSTHMQSVLWLPAEGYQVLMMDYPGFGRSEGDPNLAEAVSAVDAVFQWAIKQPQIKHQPLYLLGQSLGATIGAWYVAENEQVQHELNGLILDAPFASYHDIAREKLAGLWLTWSFQYPGSWLLPESYSPIENAEQLKIPVMVFASRNDDVVPLHHSQTLFDAYKTEKEWVETDGNHIATFGNQSNQQQLLQFLQAWQ